MGALDGLERRNDRRAKRHEERAAAIAQGEIILAEQRAARAAKIARDKLKVKDYVPPMDPVERAIARDEIWARVGGWAIGLGAVWAVLEWIGPVG